MKVGFFDSGLGGLTVLKEAIENENLNEEIYYLGDTKNTPYGTKDEEFVRRVIEDNMVYLMNIGCNPIVIACNTATSLSIKELRCKYKDTIFIGTEPAVKVAADAHKNKKILVLATSITVRQEKLLNLINELNIKDNVVLLAADELVKFAENINCSKMNKEIENYIEKLLDKYDMEEYSHIVLGCTHFPLFRENFRKVIDAKYPNNKIEIIDGAKGISKNLMNKINELKSISDVESNSDKIHIITTKSSNSFESRTKEILGDRRLEFEYKLQ